MPFQHGDAELAETADRITPLLRDAITARLQAVKLVAEIEEILAGPEQAEAQRCHVETIVSEWIDDYAYDFETVEGFGIEDAKALLEDLSCEATEFRK